MLAEAERMVFTVLRLAGKPLGGAAATPMSPNKNTRTLADASVAAGGVRNVVERDMLSGVPNKYLCEY